MKAAAPTKEGNTSGSGASSLHTEASGMSVRTSSHASPVPTTPVMTLTMTAICTVLQSGPTDSCTVSAKSASSVTTRHST